MAIEHEMWKGDADTGRVGENCELYGAEGSRVLDETARSARRSGGTEVLNRRAGEDARLGRP